MNLNYNPCKIKFSSSSSSSLSAGLKLDFGRYVFPASSLKMFFSLFFLVRGWFLFCIFSATILLTDLIS